MRASFRYLGRGSWLARRDPRTALVNAVLFVVGAVQLKDVRHLVIVLALALAYYATARIPFREVRGQWAYLAVVIVVLAGFNTIITGGRAGGFSASELHRLFDLPPFGIPITAEAISLSVSQIVRFFAIIAISLPIAYAISPGDFAVALRRLGLGDRLAFAVDLTIRFLPTLATEFEETIDAQRVRGYDPAARKGGPISRLRRLGPIFVPVTVGAIAGAEDTIDAMDLRGFGVGRRTWFRHLTFHATDFVLLGLFVLFAIVATVLNVTGRSDHYLLPFLV